MEEGLAATHRRLGVAGRFLQQMTTDFLLGHWLSLHELLKLLQVLGGIKGKASAFPAVTARTAGLLVIAFERLGHVVMDDISDIRLVYAHSESYRGHDDIHLFQQESVLVGRTRCGIHACMVWQHAYVVYFQKLGQLLHFLTAQAVYDARLSVAGLNILYDVTVNGRGLGAYLIIEIGPVERRLEDGRVCHTEILLYVMLHFRGGRRREGDDRALTDFVDYRADAPVFRSEIVAPLRDAMGLVDRIERDGNCL